MPGQPLPPELHEYLKSLVPERHPELVRMECAAKEEKFPIIGPAAGNFCYLVARMTGARRIFELGSGFGYSTLWFARAVRENGGGEVHHTVWDRALSDRARAHVAAAQLSDLVTFHVSEAVEALGAADGPFDIVFNDIDKEGYPGALPVVKAKLRPGGVLIVDNMLWGGRIFDPEAREPSTEGVREFTRLIAADPDWTVSLVPIRDGLMVARLGAEGGAP